MFTPKLFRRGGILVSLALYSALAASPAAAAINYFNSPATISGDINVYRDGITFNQAGALLTSSYGLYRSL